tara:strand:- start:26 stop:250 length:225 start_codon:yes stop_codon:yes gene_type:complete
VRSFDFSVVDFELTVSADAVEKVDSRVHTIVVVELTFAHFADELLIAVETGDDRFTISSLIFFVSDCIMDEAIR